MTRKPNRFYAVRVAGNMWRVVWVDYLLNAAVIGDCISHNRARALARYLNGAVSQWRKDPIK